MRAESSEAETTGNLTPEIVIIKNGTLSRSCTEETERIGDSAQGQDQQHSQPQQQLIAFIIQYYMYLSSEPQKVVNLP